MLTLIRSSLAQPDPVRPEIPLRADRRALSKRIWRAAAEDGTEFGFELAVPLRDGQAFFQTSTARYVLRQLSEAVVEIGLDLAPSAAAGIGWAIGNLHLELSAKADRLLAPDEPAIRSLLERLKVPYRITTAIFHPGRFVRGEQTQDLGESHRHE